MLFAISKTKGLPANCNLRKIHQQFGQRIHRRTAHRQTAKRFCRTGFRWFPQKNFSQGNRSFASGKRGFHPCFCLPAYCNCPVALSEFVTLILMIQLYLNWTVSKHAIAAGKQSCKIQFASQMWAARPHLGSIFEKLLHRKTFSLPAARFRKRCCKNEFFSAHRQTSPFMLQ